MPYERDIRILCKPIVARRKDVIYFKRYLVLSPLRSFFAGISFERSSDRDDLQPKSMVTPLCRMRPDLSAPGQHRFWRPEDRTYRQIYGDGYFGKDRLDDIAPGFWLMIDSDYPQALRAAIEAEMLPFVAALADWEKARQWETDHDFHRDPPDPQIVLPYHLAQGEFKRAKECLDVPYQERLLRDYNKRHAGLGDRLAKQGERLSRDDKRLLIALLHEREAAAIKAMKLEKHWIPTPFPAEEKGLV
jgi:hypothetical protein